MSKSTTRQDEIWAYAGLRDAGDTAVWVPVYAYGGKESEPRSFQYAEHHFQAKNAKAHSVGGFYTVSVERDDGEFLTVRFGAKTFISHEELGDLIIQYQIHDIDWLENGTLTENIQRFAALDQVARGAIMAKRAENKVNKEAGDSIMDLTLRDLSLLAVNMNRSERSILQAKVSQWLGLVR